MPFEPSLALETTPITFEQFIAWSPESKYELSDGKVPLAGVEGTRNTLAILCMTLGLKEVMGLQPPRVWVRALLNFMDGSQLEQTRLTLLGKARDAARALEALPNISSVTVFGDVLKVHGWGYWSTVTLVIPERDPLESTQVLKRTSRCVHFSLA